LRAWRAAGACIALAAPLAFAQPPIPPFSGARPGAELPPPWRPTGIKRVPMAEVALVEDEGRTVLRVKSQAAFGTAALKLDTDATVLAWRWKIDRALERARFGAKEGDDFAARLYVSFDMPLEDLPLDERVRLEFARLVYGDVPAAAICYVWDNARPRGHSAWSPYADRVRLIVLQSGNANAGRWIEERRDVAADFRAAFGRAAPRVSAIAAGNDTDQTGESATVWFGDFSMEAR
jgi:hypothetical protein